MITNNMHQLSEEQPTQSPQPEGDKCNPVSEFLWRCAGAHVESLRLCPGSQSKYTGMGSTIVFTALMAWASCGYALDSVFDNMAAAIFFGLLWAMMIFCLDRFIVSSIPGSASMKQRFLYGLPRLIMALIIGLVISAPIEMKIFEKEIADKAQDLTEEKALAFAKIEIEEEAEAKIEAKEREKEKNEARKTLDECLKGNYGPTANAEIEKQEKIKRAAESERRNLARQRDGINIDKLTRARNAVKKLEQRAPLSEDDKKELARLKAERDRLENIYAADEAKIKSLNSRIRAEETKINSAQREIDSIKKAALTSSEKEFAEAKAKTDSAQSKAQDKEQKRVNKKQKKEITAGAAETGIATRLKALHGIMAGDFHSGLAVVMIAMLFIMVELSPALLKIFLPSGAYEVMHDSLEKRAEMLSKAMEDKTRAASDQMVSEINIAVNTAVQEAMATSEKELEAKKRLHEETFEALAQAQAEVIREAIAKWKEKELKRAKENPEEYLKGATEDTHNDTSHD